MTSTQRTYIRSALRKIWKWSPERKEVQDRCRIIRGRYKCEKCGLVFPKIDIDHIIPVGCTPGSNRDKDNRTWDSFIKALFCDINNLQGLCTSCHLDKKE